MKITYLLSKLIKKIQIPAIKNSKVSKMSKICSGSHLVNTTVGKYSYVGSFSTVVNTNIGSFCSIADNCIIGRASHPISWVSTSPVFHEGRNILKKNFSYHKFQTTIKTTIGNDVWIGNNCLIKSGVKIGDGAVIGMGSIVTKDVGPYEVWAGNPAKKLKDRFNEDIKNELLNLQWWNLTDKEIQNYASYFNSVEEFIALKE